MNKKEWEWFHWAMGYNSLLLKFNATKTKKEKETILKIMKLYDECCKKEMKVCPFCNKEI